MIMLRRKIKQGGMTVSDGSRKGEGRGGTGL